MQRSWKRPRPPSLSSLVSFSVSTISVSLQFLFLSVFPPHFLSSFQLVDLPYPAFCHSNRSPSWPVGVLRAAPLTLIVAEENVIVALLVAPVLHVGNPPVCKLRLLLRPTRLRLDIPYPNSGHPTTSTWTANKNTN